jgi:hypothetical protein
VRGGIRSATWHAASGVTGASEARSNGDRRVPALNRQLSFIKKVEAVPHGDEQQVNVTLATR